MVPRAGVCSLPDTHPSGRGASPETIFRNIVPSLVMVGEDPAGREARERCNEDREFAREIREANSTGGNFTIAIAEKSMSPFPVVGMRDKETPRFDKVGPDGLNNSMRGRGGSDKDKVKLSGAEVGIQKMGQTVLRDDENRERVGGRVGENSRDGPKDDSSGLEPVKEPSVLTNITGCNVEKESESSEADVRSRMGSLTNAHASERGATSETVLDRVIPSLVVVGKDPTVRKAREGDNKNVEFAR
jgi:cyclophilin family peptidyl-prolyl cis-trans isomerase